MMPEVARIQTKMTDAQIAPILVDELRAQLGAEPNQAICEILLADIRMETGFTGDYIWNYNFGNVSINSESQDYWVNKTNKFRSFAGPEQGMKVYVHEILRRKSLKNAALSNDVDAFATGLRDTNYCPDCDPSKVGPTLSKLADSYHASGLFTNLPIAPPKGGNWFMWSVLGLSGYILYKTVHIQSSRRLSKA